MPERLELSDKIASSRRQPIDAEWSKRKKVVVSSVAGTLAVAGLAWGLYSFITTRPPSMPTTAEEAVLALASDNFDRLDGERQNAIRTQAVRLMVEAPEEERQRLRETIELSEEGRQQLREAFMEDMVRKFARGEGNPWEAMMRGGPGGPRPQGERTGDGRPGGGERSGEGGRPGGPGGGGEGGDGPSRADRQAEFRSRIQERMASGNSQTMALMGEF
ncbi:MAG: hypothetical protein KDB18_12075, partial [Salinibacterium sp.]|nr:hypothetical protein [Salinibacterium sp.]